MYRSNVCVFLFNPDGQFLGCKRLRESAYQCVQGGVEKEDLDIVVAATRELGEEIGLLPSDVHFVKEIPPPDGNAMTFSYILREGANLRRFGYIGQIQRVLLFYTPLLDVKKMILVPPPNSHATQEFQSVEWMPLTTLVERCPKEKRHIFEAVASLAPPIVEAFLAAHKEVR